MFAHPGGASSEIHQVLTCSTLVENLLCQHEQVSHFLRCPSCLCNVHLAKSRKEGAHRPGSYFHRQFNYSAAVTCSAETRLLICAECMFTAVLSLLQGEVFAAEGYAKTTGDVGVCVATSGPGATNLVTGLADPLLDSVQII